MFFVYLIVALAAGVALATQSAINTQLAKAMSGEAVIATFISFAVGTIFLFFIALSKTDLWGNLSTIPSQPWWKLIGGVLGAVVVFTTVLLAPKLGITAMLFFIIVGQLITATTIDHFGLIGMPIREVNITKFIGLIIVAFGLVFYFFGDKLLELCCLWVLIILLLLIVISIGLLRVFATPKRVTQLTNHFLAPHYHIELADDWQWETTGLTLPELKVKTDQCTLVNLNNTQVTWWNTHSLDVEKASLNYDCLTHLPSDNAEKTPPNLTALWAALPLNTFN